jgi:hypothetical protein
MIIMLTEYLELNDNAEKDLSLIPSQYPEFPKEVLEIFLLGGKPKYLIL